MNLKYFTIAILLLAITACSNDDKEEMPTEQEPNFTIWDGPQIEFVRESGSDPDEEVNQDRISQNVWITRATNGGQIYNAVTEEDATKETSPLNTKWAEGEISDISNLTFSPFRTAVEAPISVVGKKLILYLEEEDVYLPIEFTSWQSGAEGGGFSYVRSTQD